MMKAAAYHQSMQHRRTCDITLAVVVARIRALWERIDQALFYEASAVGLGVVGIWCVYWMAFYPAIVGWDPIDQLRQLHVGKLFDWHPIPHTLLIGAFVEVFGSVSALAFAQIAAAGAAYTVFYYRLASLGAPRAALWVAATWLALSPVFGTGLISIWKDSVFALGTLGMTLALLHITLSARLGRGPFIGLTAAALVVAVVRHNGPVLVACVFASCFVLMTRHRRPLAFCFLAVALIFPVVQLTSSTLTVMPRHRSLTQQVLFHHVAAFVADPAAEIPMDTAAALKAIMPRSEWEERYDCTSARDVMFDAGLTGRRLPSVTTTLRIWLDLAIRNPGILWRHSRCATRHLWLPGEPISVGPVLEGASVVTRAFDDELDIRTESLWPAANRFLTDAVRSSYDARLTRSLVWSPAVPLYATLLLTAVACRRQRSSWPLVVLLPALLNTAIWFGLASFPHIRFQFPLFLIAPLAVPLAALPRLARESVPRSDPAMS